MPFLWRLIEILRTGTKGLGRKWGVNGILTNEIKSDGSVAIKKPNRFLLRRKDSIF